jgi:glycosyltransferase involved in cell wall biosynthesis
MIVGNGALFEALKARVAALGLNDIVWLPGAREDIPSCLRAMDVFVLPSLNEGISNTILEAMASGLPVIAARVGGNPELVEPGSGLLYDHADPHALSGALVNYDETAGLARREGAAARARVVEQCSLDSMVSQYLQLYRDLLV